MRISIILFIIFATSPTWAYKWGIPAYANFTNEVLFSGTLKDELGIYHYDPSAQRQYEVESPVNCGIIRMRKGGGVPEVGVTLPTHFEDFGTVSWDDIIKRLPGPEGEETIYERRARPHDTSEERVKLLRKGGFVRYSIEYYVVNNESVQAVEMRDTSEMLIVNFMNGRPVSAEQRHYLYSHFERTDWNVWPSALKHKLKTDEHGHRYYLSWSCESDQTS